MSANRGMPKAVVLATAAFLAIVAVVGAYVPQTFDPYPRFPVSYYNPEGESIHACDSLSERLLEAEVPRGEVTAAARKLPPADAVTGVLFRAMYRAHCSYYFEGGCAASQGVPFVENLQVTVVALEYAAVAKGRYQYVRLMVENERSRRSGLYRTVIDGRPAYVYRFGPGVMYVRLRDGRFIMDAHLSLCETGATGGLRDRAERAERVVGQVVQLPLTAHVVGR